MDAMGGAGEHAARGAASRGGCASCATSVSGLPRHAARAPAVSSTFLAPPTSLPPRSRPRSVVSQELAAVRHGQGGAEHG